VAGNPSAASRAARRRAPGVVAPAGDWAAGTAESTAGTDSAAGRHTQSSAAAERARARSSPAHAAATGTTAAGAPSTAALATPPADSPAAFEAASLADELGPNAGAADVADEAGFEAASLADELGPNGAGAAGAADETGFEAASAADELRADDAGAAGVARLGAASGGDEMWVGGVNLVGGAKARGSSGREGSGWAGGSRKNAPMRASSDVIGAPAPRWPTPSR